jgi:hypothetical protein
MLMQAPIIVSATQFRSNFFNLYKDHLSEEADAKRPVRIVNKKTGQVMLDINPQSSTRKQNPELLEYVKNLKAGKFRIPDYDVQAYQEHKRQELSKTKELIAGKYD